MRLHSLLVLVTVSSLTAVACDDTSTVTPAPDAAADAAPDVAPDVAPDAAQDASPDVAPDAAADAPADSPADAVSSCGGATCTASQICLRQRTLGGAFLPPDDAGVCPAGRHPEGGSCVADFSYRCVARPTCTTADCACLGALCPASFMCRGAEAALLTCEQLAP